MSALDAVCFDLDSTLCVPELSDREFNRAVFERAGIDPLFSPRELRSVDPGEVPSVDSIEALFTELYRATLRKHDLGVDSGSPVVDDLGSIAAEVDDETGVRFRDGAREALDFARDRHRVGLVTNGRPVTQEEKLQTLGIAEELDATVYCCPAAGVPSKPATDPFGVVLSELSVSPENAVMVGDSHPEDVVGAHRAGLRSVWTPVDRPHEDLPTDPDPEPTHRVDSPSELPDVL
jgi:FMN phosphatase YigB (HAD superfamily)